MGSAIVRGAHGPLSFVCHPHGGAKEVLHAAISGDNLELRALYISPTAMSLKWLCKGLRANVRCLPLAVLALGPSWEAQWVGPLGSQIWGAALQLTSMHGLSKKSMPGHSGVMDTRLRPCRNQRN